MLPIKTRYLTEIQAPQNIIHKSSPINDADDVRRVQELINIWRFYEGSMDSGITIDGIFGPVTLKEIKGVQYFLRLNPDGIVGPLTWKAMIKPLVDTFEYLNFPSSFKLRDRMRVIAEQHQIHRPYELPPNRGPWVRSYMDGNDGKPWAWCMGFAQAILDQAFSTFNQKYTDHFVKTYLVEAARQDAKKNQRLISNQEVRQKQYEPKPGDIFLLVYPGDTNAHHAGVVVEYFNQTLTTIEGNTNFAGGREGVGVFKRRRNITEENIDLISLDSFNF